jgi:hypothetical protein
MKNIAVSRLMFIRSDEGPLKMNECKWARSLWYYKPTWPSESGRLMSLREKI